MQTLGNDALYCAKPEIIASRLTSIRNIYLRQELRTISNQIQEKFKERLPVLHLVSIAAYEQIFNRQPLSLPEELRREAVKYGLKYYQLSMEKLRTVEARNGLYRKHDRLSGPNNIVSKHHYPSEIATDENSSKVHSVSLKENNSKTNSNESTVTSTNNDNTLNLTSTDIRGIATSDESSAVSTNEQELSSTSDSNISSDTISNSPSTHSLSQRSRGKRPKIIVHRASDKSLVSSDMKKQRIKVHRSKRSNTKKSNRNR